MRVFFLFNGANETAKLKNTGRLW